MCGFLIILLAVTTSAQQPMNARPEFKAYPVESMYRGAPAPPKLSPSQRSFRTMIRRGAASKVEFAGHYTVPRWGCGTGCNGFVIVDSITGKVYDGFSIAELPLKWQESHKLEERMDFNPRSRLMKINGCPNERDCGFYDYEMIDGEGLTLVRKELLPKEFQF